MEKLYEQFDKFSFILGIISLIIIFTPKAQAESKISVTNLSGSERLFHEEHIYPGYTESHSVRIKNTSTDRETVDVYFKFDVTEGDDLAKKIHLYVIHGRDYKLGGEGDRLTLADADDEGPLFIDRLSPGQGKTYKIKIRFDRDAGNEYQNDNTKFDIGFGLETRGADKNSSLPLGNRTVSGQAPQEEVRGESTQSDDEDTELDQNPIDISGAETSKTKWSKLRWFLLPLGLIFTGYVAKRRDNGLIGK